jgi:carboxyl-terminal processing protease
MSTFVPAGEVEGYQATRQVGSSHSGVLLTKRRGIAYVVSVEAGSPGQRAGIKQGDLFASIDGESTRTTPLWRLQTRLAGTPGSRIEIEVLRRGQSLQLVLTLAEFEAEQPRLEERQEAAVIRISRFDLKAVESVREALETLRDESRTKLLVDLRGVAGADSQSAYHMGGLFVQGRLGEIRGGRQEASVDFESHAEPLWTGEVVVLIDGGSLGPAEIFASILRQKASARLVGRPSFGHAGRQAALTLSNGSQLLLTDAYFTGPDGEPIDDALTPDVVVHESFRRFAEVEESDEDVVLSRGLELLVKGEEPPLKKVA